MNQIALPLNDTRPAPPPPKPSRPARHYPEFSEPGMRLKLLKTMRSGRSYDMNWICGRVGRYCPSELSNLLEKMSADGLIQIDRHYFGSKSPAEGDYHGFKYIYRIPL